MFWGTAPADPRTLGLGHHRGERRHEATGGPGPRRLAVLADAHVHRQAVGDDEQVVAVGGHVRAQQDQLLGGCAPDPIEGP